MSLTWKVAIDGPAGAGKSTIARKAARELEFVYVDTGAMYRAMALYMLRQGFTKEDADADPAGYAQRAGEACQNADISIAYEVNAAGEREQVVLLDGENVNGVIRNQEVSEMASVTSAIPAVRVKLVELQQALARKQNVVMDGRDIGTVVLPDAQVKVYLTASSAVRARRRYLENLGKQKAGAVVAPQDLDLSIIQQDIEERDYRDMHRAASPLMQAEDAVLVDSSDMTIDQVVEAILNLVATKKADLR